MLSFQFLLGSSSGVGVTPYIILGVYVIMMVLVAYYCRKKGATTDDYFLAGRGLGGWMTAFAYGTTYFSSVVFIGYAGKLGWSFGLSVVWIGLGNAFIGAYLAWKVLAKRTRIMTQKLGSKTMPDFFQERYGDKKIKLVAALIIFVFLIPYSASVYQGLGYLFEIVFGISFVWGILIVAVLTALYLFFGGYLATAVSDFVQGIIMLVGVIITVTVLMNKVDMTELATTLSGKLGFLPSFDAGESVKLWDTPAFNILVLMLLTSLGTWGLPQSIHKFYAIKDNAAIKRGTIVSTIFCFIIGCGAYFMGSLSRLFVSDETFNGALGGNFDKIVPEMLVSVLPAALLGVIVVLVLSASMSTLSSLSLSGSGSLAMDIYKGYIKKDASDKKVGILLKLTCMLFIFLSAVFAIFEIDAIVTIMGLSWGTLAGCFIGPYLYALYSKRANKYGAWTSIIGTLVITLTLTIVFGYMTARVGSGFGEILKAGISRSPLIGVICMFYSLIFTPIANIIGDKITKGACVNDEQVKMLFDGNFKDIALAVVAPIVGVDTLDNIETVELDETVDSDNK